MGGMGARMMRYIMNKKNIDSLESLRTQAIQNMESNFLHGGKNKCLLQFSLTVEAKRDKSGNAAA